MPELSPACTQAAAAAVSSAKPKTAFVSYYSYGTTEWYQISFAAYKNELIEAAGGEKLNMTAILDIEGGLLGSAGLVGVPGTGAWAGCRRREHGRWRGALGLLDDGGGTRRSGIRHPCAACASGAASGTVSLASYAPAGFVCSVPSPCIRRRPALGVL